MKKAKWIIFVLSILIFVLISFLVYNNQTSYFDETIYKIIISIKSEPITNFLKFITNFGGKYIILIVTALFLIFMKNKRYGLFILFGAIFIVALNFALKSVFMRERPLDLMLINEDGYSFPSGHSMLALGFYGFIIYLIWQMKLSRSSKILFTVLLSLLILLIGISRIYLGVHFPSDVIGGYSVGVAYLILYIEFVRKRLTDE